MDKYEPQMEQLSDLTTTADPSGEGTHTSVTKALRERYDALRALVGERRGLVSDFLPIVQQYESSRGAWQDLLCGWEERAEGLPPPSATPANIQAQLEDLKVS